MYVFYALFYNRSYEEIMGYSMKYLCSVVTVYIEPEDL